MLFIAFIKNKKEENKSMWDYIFYLVNLHLKVIIIEVITILVIINLLVQKKGPTSIFAWVFGIILMPYIVLPLYFIIGLRKVKKQKTITSLPSVRDKIDLNYKNENNFIENNIQKIIQSNRNANRMAYYEDFELITNGIDAFNALITGIKLAKKSIHFSTYVFQDDICTNRIIDELTKKQKNGVTVRLLIDSMGSYKLYFSKRKILQRLIKAGGKVKFFMPIIKTPWKNRINLRNHRKIYLIDDKILFTGGMNLGNEYMGESASNDRWVDLFFKIRGKTVIHFYNLFLEDWHYSTDEDLKFILEAPLKKYGNSRLQTVPSGPDVEDDALYESIIVGIHSAKKRIWIVTPYYIPSEPLQKSLIIAHKKGIDVKIITPKKSNHLIADATRNSYMRELSNEGIKLCLTEGVMIHAKAILFDDSAVMLGSVNLDNRSLFLNYEVAIYAYSNKEINDIKKWMKNLALNSSHKLERKGRFNNIIEGFTRIIAPLL